MEEFIEASNLFYEVGSKTFLSQSMNRGCSETFYMHVLRYYIPKIAMITLERHRLGVGIFSTQSFERRNNESKNCLKRFSNNKGKLLSQI